MLISREELQAIRRIWVLDEHETKDKLPQIYEEATSKGLGQRFGSRLNFCAALRRDLVQDVLQISYVRCSSVSPKWRLASMRECSTRTIRTPFFFGM